MSSVEVELMFGRRPRPTRYDSKIGGYAVLYGYSVKESTGLAVAELDLYDGVDSTSTIFLPIPMSAGQGAENWFGPQGIHFINGLTPVVASGAVAGVLFLHLPS